MTTTAPDPDDRLQLAPRDWLLVLALLGVLLWLLPRLAQPTADAGARAAVASGTARIADADSDDYFGFAAQVAAAADADVLVLGDSFVQGAGVPAAAALPACLTRHDGRRFANLGFLGAHPVALAGALRFHGDAIRDRRVLLHLNLLWLGSPRQDLSDDKEAPVQHPRLLPQFDPTLRAYRAELETRLDRAIEQRLPAATLWHHLRHRWLDGLDPASWLLANPDRWWPQRPAENAEVAADEGTRSWCDRGIAATDFDWVPLDESVQWRAFDAAISRLQAAGNRVVVIIGPFNEHLLTERARRGHGALRDAAATRLRRRGLDVLVPDVLPSELYADASHPLAAGYRLLAQRLSLPQ